ncbi:MAG: HD domain-containing protein [Actinobacteria bacterium]|jgi:HD superfamily phosphodiesterase|nr:HD domain-containing protein [Actinomycetota bacterium]
MPSQSPSPTIRTLASGFSPDGDWPSLDDVWRAAEPALRARSNDIHTPLSFAFAELLLETHPEADPLVVRVAILLHDSGWSRVDESKIISEGFRGDWRTSDVRYLHELEGCNIAREILPGLGYEDAFITRVTDIIDGHDTRLQHHSIEDALVRDADRLWRFTPTGIGLASGWFGKTPSQYHEQLKTGTFRELITDSAREIAAAELARSVELLKLDVI